MMGNEMIVENTEQADALAKELTHYKRLDAAGLIIASSTKWSVAASLIPIPFLDMASLGLVQVNMIVDITKLYDEKVTRNAVQGVVSVLFGTLAPFGAAHFATSSIPKFLPGYGTALGAITLATFGAAATYSIGKIFVRHYENGGSFSNFSASTVQAELKKEFTKTFKD